MLVKRLNNLAAQCWRAQRSMAPLGGDSSKDGTVPGADWRNNELAGVYRNLPLSLGVLCSQRVLSPVIGTPKQ